ncbi:hypothetical protein AB1L42_06665 [Thalassoglobus sp. JC818]|uniref:hypothetical protein n=1 Tax=Thalassoglobus sp. JC818 TaxID=3232136 RepID=UPI00345A4963
MAQSVLSKEEYIEQAYFFRVYRERLDNNTPSQEILAGLKDEVLTTTKLPLAIDFLMGEIQLNGRLSDGMARLKHYFLPFQTFIIQMAEEDNSKFDFRVALKILEREAEFRSSEEMSAASLFVYQFECLARNRLGYDRGILAISEDPAYSDDWQQWIRKIRFELGTVDFADLVYLRSEQHAEDVRRRTNNPEYQHSYPTLFDRDAGRIARANSNKDPLYMFAALQRQLGYPQVPKLTPVDHKQSLHPKLEARLQRLEARVAFLEQEEKGGIDLTEFYEKGGQFTDDPM